MQLGAGLCLATADSARWQQVVADGSATGVAVRLDEQDRRVRLGLSFLGGSKVVDVSPDPASWVRCARSGARARHEPDARWADALSTGLRRTGIDRGWWNELPANLAPDLTAAAAAWPLARPAIEAGFDERCVPRWAVPLLSATDVATGTRAVLGARADRRVIREMANALAGTVRWWPIACAIALEQLDAGRIGDMLAQTDATYRCSQDERLLLTRSLGDAPPDIVRRLLGSAQGQDGPARLLAALDGWQRTIAKGQQLPNRLDRLETLVLAELEVPPAPRPAPERPARAIEMPARFRRHRPRQEEALEPNRRPRPNRRPPQDPERLNLPVWWQRLHRARRDAIDLILPTQRQDVVRWGQALNNCLGAYADAVADGRTLIVGIRCDQRLVGAVEIDPTNGTIRQLEGCNNQPLVDDLQREVLQLLQEHGVTYRTL